LERERHRLWEEIHQAGGPYPLSSLADIKASQARFEAVAKKNGYSKLCDQVNPIAEKGDALAKRILEIEPTDRTGDSIHAAAVLLIDEPEGELGELLKRMAGRAGFSVTV
jgi:hypothetical protein